MEFGTGHDVRPGDDITMETSSGSENLGQATYDSDHDGVGDSVIVIDGDHQYLITDADRDGYADSVRAFDASGHEVDPRSGDPIDPPSGSASGGTATDGTEEGSNLQRGFGADGMTLIGVDGTSLALGAATVDLDRDGAPDTAVVREPDGAVVGYTDRDGDGVADQMTRIGPSGDVVIALRNSSGGWEVAATGQLDDSGTLVEDPVVAVGSIG